MAFYQSPLVAVTEKDLSVSAPAVATAITGMVGKFRWGACFERKQVSQASELLAMFYEPNDDVYEDWYSAYNYLQYANNLILVRAVDKTVAKNAGLKFFDTENEDDPTTAPAYIGNTDDAEAFAATFASGVKWQILAKYCGTRGNDLKVAIAGYTDYASAEIVDGMLFSSQFEFPPADATEMQIAVIDTADDNKILEKWTVSLTKGAKNLAMENYYCQDYINSRSAYILLYNNASDIYAPANMIATALTGGVNGYPSNANIETGYDLFESKDDVDVTMLIDGANTNNTVQKYIISLCENRADCLAMLCVPKSTCVGAVDVSSAVADMVDYVKTDLNTSSSWSAVYGNWKYQYDRYADKNRWLPMSGDTAGITALTHYTRDPWFAPAFYNRGQVKNCIKLAVNPKLSYRSTMYQASLNPIITSTGDGTVVLGQKTMLTAPSAFNRLDVRWLFLVIEKSLAIPAKYVIGEKNNAFTRSQFKGACDRFLRYVQGRDGLEEFFTQCDENVNTPDVIGRNEFRASFYLKPTITAEFIALEMVNVGQGVSFTEIIKKA